MKHRSRGQIMPFCVFLIMILLWVIFSNFEIGFVNFKKTQQQKEIDAVTLDLSTQFARGYNAIAAINDGLLKIRNHGLIIAGVAAAAHACAVVAVPPCIRYVAKLDPKLPPFFKNLYDLGQEMKKDQENIQKWMISTYCSKELETRIKYRLALYPRYSCRQIKIEELPLTRAADEDFNGVMKCHKTKIENYSQFHSFIENHNNSFDNKSIEIHVIYENYETKRKYYAHPVSFQDALLIQASIMRKEGSHYRSYNFKRAELENCENFKNFFSQLSTRFSQLLLLPGPLKLKDEFFNSKNRFIALAAPGFLDEGSPFKDKHGDILSFVFNNTWTVSESKILGSDLNEMEFTPRLNAVSLHKELDEEIKNHPPISSYLARFPKLSEMEDDIHH